MRVGAQILERQHGPRQMLQDVQHDNHVWLDRRLEGFEVAADEVDIWEIQFPTFDRGPVDINADPPYALGEPCQESPVVAASVQHGRAVPQQTLGLQSVYVLLVSAD